MTNSYECSILGLYSGIFLDIQKAFPSISGMGRDESRLLSTVKSRGIRFITIDLPAYGKHFDRCLSDGRLTPSSIPCFGWSGKGTRSHAFLRGLVLRVFEADGVLKSHPCVDSIFFLRQLFYAAKKIKMDCSEKVRESTLQRYIDQERSLRPSSLNWLGDRLDDRGCGNLRIDDFRNCDRGPTADLFQDSAPSAAFCDTVHQVADRVFSSFGTFEPMEWRPKHGPGAVGDRPEGKFKYNFPTWSTRLESVFPYADLAFANHGEWADSLANGEVIAVSDDLPSVALTVPKSQKAPRIIAKEPTANMWCQQIVRDYLERSVQKSFLRDVIHFGDQSYNGDAALSSSSTGTHWTVDLSDASDRVSLWLVERLVRSNKTLLTALHASRSTICKVQTREGTNFVRMKKFAPQGAATTFPLQSIVYSIFALSAVLYSRGWKVTPRNLKRVSQEVLVFGDDTVIPGDSGQAYVEILTYCGFFVNYAKTYGTGKFRESCGVEAYDGADVTPAYITIPYQESVPSSIASVVECSNNFHMKGLWHAADRLQSTLPYWVHKDLAVKGVGDGAFGLTSFAGRRPPRKTRWNSTLQRREYLTVSPSAKQLKSQPGGTGHLLQYFTEAPTQDIHWMSGVGGQPVVSVRRRWEAERA